MSKKIKDVIQSNVGQSYNGAVLRQVLSAMADSTNRYGLFAGVAQTDTLPSPIDQNVFYVAAGQGLYANFGGIYVSPNEGISLLVSDTETNTWSKVSVPLNIQHETSVSAGVGVDVVKGIYYVPRKAKDNFWLTALLQGTLTLADIEEDFNVMKSLLGINTVRIFTYYDIEWRKQVEALKVSNFLTTAQAKVEANKDILGMANGEGLYNQKAFDALSQVIDLAKRCNLEVIPTMFQELKALKSTDDWGFLETELDLFKEFTAKMVSLFDTKTNVRYVILKNEPDGFGVWADKNLAVRVLNFLYDIKQEAKLHSTRIKFMVNSTTHDNIFKKFPSQKANSIYSLTDVVCLNSFLWADTGFWSGVNYATQFKYVKLNNQLNKPMFLTECGFPMDYVNQRVAGSNGETVTDESTVPINDGLFDRPYGRAFAREHNEENQSKAIKEALYWADYHNFDGALVWSAFEHSEDSLHDSFAIINYDNTPKLACKDLKNFRVNTLDALGTKHISCVQGFGSGVLNINGLTPYNPAQSVDNGVYLGSNSNWNSFQLVYEFPLRLRLVLEVLSQQAEPLTVELKSDTKSIQFRYKKYDKNAFQFWDVTNNVELGWSQACTLPVGVPFNLDLDLNDYTPRLYLDGVELICSPNNDFEFLGLDLENLYLQVYGVQAHVKIHSMGLVGVPYANVNNKMGE